jgi:uroporphyrinogen decarboxylase
MGELIKNISPRERVNTALDHKNPDQTPVDFLAVPEIWERTIEAKGLQQNDPVESEFFDSLREMLLREYEVDCRVISYDQFCNPPDSVIKPDAEIDWYGSLGRSTPNRMWRQVMPNGQIFDIWGRHFRVVENPSGSYEELASYPLDSAESVGDLKNYSWPEPDWWDFSNVKELLDQLDSEQEYHLRYRIGSVFEVAWQLRAMDTFLLDLAINPDLPFYIMERLTDIYVEITDRFLSAAGDRIDMVYFYDDVATQNSLMISKAMWEQYVKPHHKRIIDVAKAHNQRVMYHCDGALYPLIPDLIDLGIDVLNPIQADAKGMHPTRLKNEFGGQLSFHGGIDIIKTLPQGTPEDVQNEVKTRISQLGTNGGYIMASSHHIQADTPLENVEAMYDLSIR